jgi:hypothetical protein
MKPIILKIILFILFMTSTFFSVVVRYQLFGIAKKQKEDDRKTWAFYLLLFSAFISLCYFIYSFFGSASNKLKLASCRLRSSINKKYQSIKNKY